VLAQRFDQRLGQRDVTLAGARLRRLEADAMRLGLLQRLADLDNLAVKIDAVPA
jgi:hypothetical protein